VTKFQRSSCWLQLRIKALFDDNTTTITTLITEEKLLCNLKEVYDMTWAKDFLAVQFS